MYIKKFIKTLWSRWCILVEEHNKLINPDGHINRVNLWHKTDIFIPLFFGPCVTLLINQIHYQPWFANGYLCIIITSLTYLAGHLIWQMEIIKALEDKNEKE